MEVDGNDEEGDAWTSCYIEQRSAVHRQAAPVYGDWPLNILKIQPSESNVLHGYIYREIKHKEKEGR